jgi:hypothetical protein
MLYNMPSNMFLQGSGSSADESSHDNDKLKDVAQNMLEECLREYKGKVGDDTVLELVPNYMNVFRFPPYRCVITFLYLSTTPALTELHQTLVRIFPPDERHDSGASLMPHMSLVYAPETMDTFLFEETKRIKNDTTGTLLLRPMRAKYLSVWSTKGKTSDWVRIAKVEL